MRDSAFAVNHELRSRGFASLNEGAALASQLAYFVRDHAHLRSLLNACEPEHRRDMYEALAPNLRFKARPLADYLIELAQDAEARQLPTIGANGELQAFKAPEITTEPTGDVAIAERAAGDVVAKEHLHVVCLLCTREDVFSAIDKQAAVDESRAAGWRRAIKRSPLDPTVQQQVEICPACVKQRAPRRLLA